MTAPLLAKSKSKSEGSTLSGHTVQVMDAARALLEVRADAVRAATGQPLEGLERIAMLAAFGHDLGKANDGFQGMLNRTTRAAQPIRHEALSLLLMWGPLREWLRTAFTDREIALAACAVAGHHRKFQCKALAENGVVTALLGHPHFHRLLRLGQVQLGLGAPPTPVSETWGVIILRRMLKSAESETQAYVGDAGVLLSVVKSFVLAADVLGSAVPKASERAPVVDLLQNRATADDLLKVADSRLAGATPRPFQAEVGASAAPVTLVTAGCGSGKTVAAYLWAAQHAPRQLWVCYPTTGTATEGYRDYLTDLDLDARLEHSRREVDVEMLGLQDTEEDGAQRDADRYQALVVWGAKVVSCTVDTVLGLMQCQRKGMYAFPALAHGAFVFDEIHAWDDDLFGTFLRFLAAFPGAPVLLMTASLPEARRAALDSVVREVHGTPLATIQGPPELEGYLRYERSGAVSSEEVAQQVEACLARGGKVLWVCNQVKRCQEVADQRWSIPPLMYHSRYRYGHRVEHHQAIVQAFAGSGACFAVTTQVCEMSLDLSADLLVTELAPVPSLIQRLGRLNRRADGTSTRPFLVIEPESHLPYEVADLDAARQWVRALPQSSSQADLVAAWVQEGGDPPRGKSAWLDGGFNTVAQPLRTSTPGVDILLADEAPAVKGGQVDVVKATVPMTMPPKREWPNWRTWPRYRGRLIPPIEAVHYDSNLGASWR